MHLGKILVVDDDPNLLELVRMRLESANYEVTTASREEKAIEAAREGFYDLAILDLQLAHRDGISLMEEVHLILPDLPVIILTAYGSIENAVEAMRRGAYSYLTKPFEPRDLLLQIERALEKRRLTTEVQRLKGLLSERYGFSNIVAKSSRMQQVLDGIAQIAQIDSTVYIHGESGTGKELIAKAIHLASKRKDRSFVAINCAALPETMLESSLFGHEKGAFTGAVQASKGLFVQAHEGTIFLDEIGDMSLPTQAKLLRVLQERNFYPLGSQKLAEVDVRVIVATNKNLEEMVKEGLFREDLFYRIHVIPIMLPPLRERKEDIPLLVDYFLKKFNQQMKKEIKGFTSAAIQKLMLYDWPGNIRELENTVEYAMVMTQDEWIKEDSFFKTKTTLPQDDRLKPLREAKEAYEKDYLIQLLDFCKGNVSQAARIAGKYRADFYELIKKHNLDISRFKK
jgi:two-component system response regulator GlrR